jgi:putative transposase
MTAGTSIDPALTKTLDPGEFLHEQLSQPSRT